MKKIITVLVCMVCGLMCFAQNVPHEEKISDAKVSEDMKMLKLGYELANYGYENDSATALLQAVEILNQVKSQAGDFKGEKSGESSAEKPAVEGSFKVEELIKSAKELAGKDKSVQEWAKKLEKTAKTSTRGAVGGSKWAEDIVYGNNGYIYYDIFFRADELAEITVASYNGADLDVYVDDQNGNPIVCDDLPSTDCYVNFSPRWTGNFRIYVINRSRWNSGFRLTTN